MALKTDLLRSNDATEIASTIGEDLPIRGGHGATAATGGDGGDLDLSGGDAGAGTAGAGGQGGEAAVVGKPGGVGTTVGGDGGDTPVTAGMGGAGPVGGAGGRSIVTAGTGGAGSAGAGGIGGNAFHSAGHGGAGTTVGGLGGDAGAIAGMGGSGAAGASGGRTDLEAGDGGAGSAGAGGVGGNANHTAGDGGAGTTIGGDGGNAPVTAGDGAGSATAGGAGGDAPTSAGDGGSATAGPGGDGGSAPTTAGDGAGGTTAGGAGGNAPVTAGDGGVATAGAGGDGGDAVTTAGDGAAGTTTGGNGGDAGAIAGDAGAGATGGTGGSSSVRGGAGGASSVGAGGAGGEASVIAGNAGASAAGGTDGAPASLQAGLGSGTGVKGRQRIGTLNLAESEFGGAHRTPLTTVTNADVTLNETHDFVAMSTGAVDRTVNLPTAVGITGRWYEVKKIDAGAGRVLIDPFAAQTIDGAATRILASQFEAVIIISDGANWLVFPLAFAGVGGLNGELVFTPFDASKQTTTSPDTFFAPYTGGVGAENTAIRVAAWEMKKVNTVRPIVIEFEVPVDFDPTVNPAVLLHLLVPNTGTAAGKIRMRVRADFQSDTDEIGGAVFVKDVTTADISISEPAAAPSLKQFLVTIPLTAPAPVGAVAADWALLVFDRRLPVIPAEEFGDKVYFGPVSFRYKKL